MAAVPSGGSAYERRQVDFFLEPRPRPVERGAALVVLPHGEPHRRLYETAIGPALVRNGLNEALVRAVFDDESPLPNVCAFLLAAEVVVVDVTWLNPSVMYVLGLAHGLGRCPILITGDAAGALPFDLSLMRCIEYDTARLDGIVRLRDRLDRAVRIFLAARR